MAVALGGSTPAIPAPPLLQSEPSKRELRRLPFRKPVELRFSLSRKDTWLLRLDAGEYIEILVKELQGADVILFLLGPDGKPLQEIDTRPLSEDHTEVVATVTRLLGTHRLVIRAQSAKPGGFRVLWKTARPASPGDFLRAQAYTAFLEGEAFRRANSWHSAHQCYQKALRLWMRLRERAWAAQARHRIGLLYKEQDQYVQALKAWEAVLPVWRGTSNEPDLLNEIGTAERLLGQHEKALEHLNRSLALSRQARKRGQQADSYNRMGLVYSEQGEFQEALDAFQKALILHPERDLNHALFLANLSEVLMDLGDYRIALERCLRALEIIEEEGDDGALLLPLRTLGLIYLGLGDEQKALQALHKGETLARELRHPGDLARLLNALGNVHVVAARYNEARRVHQEALEVATRTGDQGAIAHASGNLGYLVDRAGDPEEAIRLFEYGVGIYKRKGHRLNQAQALSGKALALWHLGRFEEAQETLEQLIGIIEALRAEPESGHLRTSFFASRQRGYEAYMELIMERHRKQPGAGFDLLAFEAAELTRARSLLEDLGKLHLEDVTPELFQSLRNRDRTLVQALAGESALAQPSRKANRRAEGDESPSRLSTLVRPLSVPELQQWIADDQTLILAYKLGPKKSYLWLIGQGLADSHELPGRTLIEEKVRETRALLARSSERAIRVEVVKKARGTAELLLGPVAKKLEGKRLVVIPDGELHSLPFGVLPDPAYRTVPEGRWWPIALIENHEIVYEPSASVLAFIREQAASRPPPPRRLALLAPEADETIVFSSQPGEGKLAALPPLSFSRQEAEAIVERVSADRRIVAIGASADLRLARHPVLGRHEIIHFAGHALVDPSDLASSGLVLSGMDRLGEPRREMLRIDEIHGLDLPVDLVVLSACSTGLGEQIPGEGLVGLTRGFLYAGASRVVTSLWNVRDRATGNLMDRFYEAMLDRGLSPAAALREAQIEMLRSQDRQAPYYWGGFVLQGEWR